ncbi:MAG: transferase [Caldimonas sp.]
MPSEGTDEKHAVPFVRKGLTSIALHFSIEETQSRMQIGKPDALDLRYTRTMMGFLMFEPAPLDIAMIGLGGGSIVKFCYRHLPKARIDAVEINPRIIELRDDFQVPRDDERFAVIEGDGAQYVRDSERRYDVLLLDAFGPDGLPRRMSSQSFYDDCLDLLKRGGILVSNFHTAARDFKACVERLEQTFDGICLVVEDREAGNTIVFARKQVPLALPADARVKRPRGLDAGAWSQLGGAFERIATAHARRLKERAA